MVVGIARPNRSKPTRFASNPNKLPLSLRINRPPSLFALLSHPPSAMDVASLSSLGAFFSVRHLSRLLRNPSNRSLLVRMIPRNPSRGIFSCCAATDPQLSSSFGWRCPSMLQRLGRLESSFDVKSQTLVTSHRPYGGSPEIEKKEESQHEHTPTVAMVSCATIDEVPDAATLCFSTFDSAGALLKRFSIPAGDSRPCVVSSASGDLLLIRADNSSFLCDIATQELITLPDIPGGYRSYGGTGLGFVPSTKEFKVLADLYADRDSFKVLTLGADRWRDVEDPPLKVEHYGGPFLNGCIHLWSGHGNYSIPAFNVEKEQWGSIAGPPVERSPPPSLREYKGYACTIDKWGFSIRGPTLDPHTSLMKLNGYLCILDRWLAVGQASTDIWLLKDYHNGSWVKECNIPYSAFKRDGRGPFMVEPLAIEEDGRMLVQIDAYSLQLYDPKTNTSHEIHRFEEESGRLRNLNIKILSSLRHR